MTIDIHELRILVQDFQLAGSPMFLQTTQMNELLDRMEAMQDALRRHHEAAMGAGLDPSHPLTKLRVSAYQQSCLYANTVAALEESK